MIDTKLSQPVALVLERDVPVRMTLSGERFYIDGAPEPLGRTAPTRDGAVPHPASVTGWRFHGTSVDGETHTFEVVSTGMARWNLRAVHN
jgi:hypothetical protein